MINIDKCKEGLRNIRVIGVVDSEQRREAISDAIKDILQDGASALKTEYIGVKQYSGFGDQRCDCSYGMGPTHGSIVFEIGRNRKSDSALGESEVYLLECERDFKPLTIIDNHNQKRQVNLSYILNQIEIKELELEVFKKHLELQTVDSHTESPNAD